jgi:hypothetical protein
MVLVPMESPDTMPVPTPTVATLAVPLAQVPPTVASLNAAVVPSHKVVAPVMASGTG